MNVLGEQSSNSKQPTNQPTLKTNEFYAMTSQAKPSQATIQQPTKQTKRSTSVNEEWNKLQFEYSFLFRFECVSVCVGDIKNLSKIQGVSLDYAARRRCVLRISNLLSIRI